MTTRNRKQPAFINTAVCFWGKKKKIYKYACFVREMVFCTSINNCLKAVLPHVTVLNVVYSHLLAAELFGWVALEDDQSELQCYRLHVFLLARVGTDV